MILPQIKVLSNPRRSPINLTTRDDRRPEAAEAAEEETPKQRACGLELLFRVYN